MPGLARAVAINGTCVVVKVFYELIQFHMAQKPVLRGEVGCACVAREVSVERGGMGERGCEMLTTRVVRRAQVGGEVNHRPRGRGGHRKRRGLLGDLGACALHRTGVDEHGYSSESGRVQSLKRKDPESHALALRRGSDGAELVKKDLCLVAKGEKGVPLAPGLGKPSGVFLHCTPSSAMAGAQCRSAATLDWRERLLRQ